MLWISLAAIQEDTSIPLQLRQLQPPLPLCLLIANRASDVLHISQLIGDAGLQPNLDREALSGALVLQLEDYALVSAAQLAEDRVIGVREVI